MIMIAEYCVFPIRLMLIENVDLPQLWNIFNQVSLFQRSKHTKALNPLAGYKDGGLGGHWVTDPWFAYIYFETFRLTSCQRPLEAALC